MAKVAATLTMILLKSRPRLLRQMILWFNPKQAYYDWPCSRCKSNKKPRAHVRWPQKKLSGQLSSSCNLPCSRHGNPQCLHLLPIRRLHRQARSLRPPLIRSILFERRVDKYHLLRMSSLLHPLLHAGQYQLHLLCQSRHKSLLIRAMLFGMQLCAVYSNRLQTTSMRRTTREASDFINTWFKK